MRAASAATIALLATGEFYMAELYTFTLVDGTVIRYSAANTDITVGANTWSRTGLKFQRGNVKTVLGLETDTMDLTVSADPDDATAQIKGVPFAQALLAGALDGATIENDRVFMPTWGDTSGGLVVWFYGIVGDIQPGRLDSKIPIKDLTTKLNIQLPREIYGPGCLHTLYDAGCGLHRSDFAATATVASGSTTTSIKTNLTADDDYNALGYLVFTSGALNGVQRAIKAYSKTNGLLTVYPPLSSAPIAGVTATVYPGCDKRSQTCGGVGQIITGADVSSDKLTVPHFAYAVDTAVRFTASGIGQEIFAVDISADTISVGVNGFTYPVDTPIKFTNVGGALPAPLVAGTTYYVRDEDVVFHVSATSGGSAINLTTAGTGVSSVHGVGTLPAPLAEGTTYYVLDAALDFRVALTEGGAQINLTTTGTGIFSTNSTGKFNNLLNFKGFPLIPVPETAH